MMRLDQLLDDASQRRVAYTPDIDALLRTGRRRHRNRVAVSAIAAAAAAAVTAGAIALLGGRDGVPAPSNSLPAASSPSAPASPSVSAADARILRECGKQYDNTGEVSPRGYDFSRWSVAVSASDSSGTSAVLLSPDRERYAPCAFSPPQWTGGAERGVDILPVRAMPVPHGWRSGFAPVTWAYDCNLKRSATCEHEVWAGTALLPGTVSRVTVRTRDGFSGEAVVRNGFMAFRHVAPYKAIMGGVDQGSGAGTMPPVLLTLYDSAGRKLTSFNQNYLPPIANGSCPSTGGC
jgi:hypothetical protein